MARPPDPDRRARTLADATDYVLRNGLAGLSLRPMAAALGTSTRMLLYDFGSKEKLVTEILAEARHRRTDMYKEHLSTVARPNRDTAERCRSAGRKLAVLSDEDLSLALNDEQLVTLYNLFAADEDLQ